MNTLTYATPTLTDHGTVIARTLTSSIASPTKEAITGFRLHSATDANVVTETASSVETMGSGSPEL